MYLKQKFCVKVNDRKPYEEEALRYFSIPLYFVHLTFYILFNKIRKISVDRNFHLNTWKYIFQVTNRPMHQFYIHSTACFIELQGFFPTKLFLHVYIEHLTIFCSIRKYETDSSMPCTICSHCSCAKWMQIIDFALQF